jgi:hypothetical protein
MTVVLMLERALAAGVDDCGVRCCENLFEAFAFLNEARAGAEILALFAQFSRVSD